MISNSELENLTSKGHTAASKGRDPSPYGSRPLPLTLASPSRRVRTLISKGRVSTAKGPDPSPDPRDLRAKEPDRCLHPRRSETKVARVKATVGLFRAEIARVRGGVRTLRRGDATLGDKGPDPSRRRREG